MGMLPIAYRSSIGFSWNDLLYRRSLSECGGKEMIITIRGNPIPKNRIRCRCISGHGSAYDPQVKDMNFIRTMIMSETLKIGFKLSETHQDSSIEVYLRFYLPVNKSETEAQKNLKLWGILPCNSKPDFDNLVKLYLDCANGILWPDDKMIIKGTGHKVKYSNNPRTEIEIMTKKEFKLDNAESMVFKTFSPEEMKSLMVDAACMGSFYERNDGFFEDIDTEAKESFLSSASMLLIVFATKYADKLKKITKSGSKR